MTLARSARVVRAAHVARVGFMGFLVSSAVPCVATAAEYRFVRVADTRDGGFTLDSSRHPAINNAGNVALYRNLPGFVGGYYSGNGGPLATIATNSSGPLAGLTLYRPSFNDSGQIAFFADDVAAPDPFRVYRAGPGGVTLVAATGAGTFNGFVPEVSINNSGNVAFTVGASGALDGLYVGNGTGNTRMYPEAGAGRVLSVGSAPSYNNHGSASFAGKLLGAPGTGSAHIKGAGGTPSVIADESDDLSIFAESVVNDGGLVVYGGTRFSRPQGIFTGTGGSTATTFVDVSGPYSNLPIHYATGFAAPGYPTMNNHATVAFCAELDAGGAGIFTGPDPATSAVIKAGDALFGATVDTFAGGLGREAINDAGELAFHATLTGGGGEVVVKAIPAVTMKWSADADGVWSGAGNWIGPVPNAFHHDANFTDAITAPRTITVDGAFTVGSINFDNAHKYTLSGPGSITLDDSYGGRLQVYSGSHELDVPLFVPRYGQAIVTTGSEMKLGAGVTGSAGSSLHKSGGGPLSMLFWRGLSIGGISDGRVSILPNGTPAATSTLGKLELAGTTDAWTATLDLNDNDLVLDYEPSASPLATVANQIKSARGVGSWTGNGITSSMADASSFALGYAESSSLFTTFPATFSGQTVDDSAVLIAYTRYGDATLDGMVNLSDFNRLAGNFGLSGTFWYDGDFNYDGNVNLADFNLLAANFGLSATGPEVTPQDWARLGAAVPEPASLALFGVLASAAMSARGRRRRRA